MQEWKAEAARRGKPYLLSMAAAAYVPNLIGEGSQACTGHQLFCGCRVVQCRPLTWVDERLGRLGAGGADDAAGRALQAASGCKLASRTRFATSAVLPPFRGLQDT